MLTEIFLQFKTYNWKKISVITEKKFQLVYYWNFIPVWNKCQNGYFKKSVEINRGIGAPVLPHLVNVVCERPFVLLYIQKKSLCRQRKRFSRKLPWRERKLNNFQIILVGRLDLALICQWDTIFFTDISHLELLKISRGKESFCCN